MSKGRIPRHRRPCEDVGVSGESARILARMSVSVSWNAALTVARRRVTHARRKAIEQDLVSNTIKAYCISYCNTVLQ